MPYCTQADIEEQISPQELIELTDDAGTGAVDTTVLARAIADADAEIDSYCGLKYTVPFSPVPAIVRKVSVDLAAYHLHSRRVKIPDDRKARYENAVRLLRDVAKGIVTLGVIPPPSASSYSGIKTNKTSEDRIFTPDSMALY